MKKQSPLPTPTKGIFKPHQINYLANHIRNSAIISHMIRPDNWIEDPNTNPRLTVEYITKNITSCNNDPESLYGTLEDYLCGHTDPASDIILDLVSIMEFWTDYDRYNGQK